MLASAPELLDKHEASKFLSISHRRLGDPAWRRRFNLRAIKVGGSLRFEVDTLRRWLEDRQDKFDGDAA